MTAILRVSAFGLLLLASLLAGASVVRADDRRWVVVYTTTVPAHGDELVAVSAFQAQFALTRLPVLTDERARELARARLSREPQQQASPDLLESLSTAIRNLEMHVALRRREEALAEAARIRQLSDPALDSLLDERNVARRLFHACIQVAQVYFDEGDETRTRDQLERCRELDAESSADSIPAPRRMRAMLREVDARVSQRPRGSLVIASDGPRCRVVLNGRRIDGETPLVLGQVPTGEHRVELACGAARGRVHIVQVAAEPQRLTIDTVFDAALHTDGLLTLAYPDMPTQARRRAADALTIARAVDAGHVALVSRDGEGTLRIDHLSVDRTVFGSVILSTASATLPQQAHQAAEAMALGTSIDVRSGRPIARWRIPSEPSTAAPTPSASSAAGTPSPGPDEPRATATNSAPPHLGGFILGGVGLATLGVSVWALVNLDNLEYRAGVALPGDPDYESRQRAYQSFRPLPGAIGVAGGLVLAGSLPWLLPAADGIPWWSYLVGAAGLGGAAYATFSLATDGQIVGACSLSCSKRAGGPLGGVVLGFSLPLVGVPLVHVVRALLGVDVTTSVTADANHAVLQLSGRF